MISRPQSRFLELDALTALQGMRFSARHRIEGSYSGRHVSRQKGGSGEFADYREYTPGEDLRRLDWRVMARTGRAYVKLFEDETNLVCTLAIDCSNSMKFSGFNRQQTGSKIEYAQYFTTALSHIISYGRDLVGLAVTGDRLQEYLPPGSTSEHVARLHEMIQNICVGGQTNLEGSLEQLFQRVVGRGVLLLISDFLCDQLDRVFAALRLFRHRGWDVVVLHLVHPDEEQLPNGTAFRFEGLEGEGLIDCSPGEIEQLYRRRLNEHLATVRTLSLSASCDYQLVSTATPYLRTLSGFLVERTG